MKKAFIKIESEHTFSSSQSNLILSNIFLRKKTNLNLLQPHLLLLTPTTIFYYHNSTNSKIKRSIPLDFNTKFQIIKDQDFNYIGIKFQRQNHIPYELYSHQHHIIKQWQQELQKKINKRGFHQQFKAIKKIGKGNFAAVYLSIRKSDQKSFAVKAFSKQQVYGQQLGREALINQIKLLRMFNSPNIMKLIAVYESANSIYLVQQYLQGPCLNTILAKQQLRLSNIKSILKGLLFGLVQLSSKNVIHRDLKPQNLIFRTSQLSSDIVIIDFGLGTLSQEKQYIFKRCGTPGFVAPQIVNLKDFSIKSKPISDVFSVGIIFHLMLLGRSIFKGKTFNEVLIQNRNCNFLFNSTQYSHLTTQSFDLLKKMLQVNPNIRISAQQCLKHEFFNQYQNQIQIQFSIITKGLQSMKFSGILQDSLGEFKMNGNKEKKNLKQRNSLYFKQNDKNDKNDKNDNNFLTVPKKSKFGSYRKRSGNDMNTPSP